MITHQKQPTDNSCMCTCLAMLVNKPAQEVIDKWHDRLMAQEGDWLDDVLDWYNFDYFYGHPSKQVLTRGNRYLLCVPSLNVVGGLHQILVEYSEGQLKVYDPQQGNEGMRYYTAHEPLTANGEQLTSWSIDLIIPIKAD